MESLGRVLALVAAGLLSMACSSSSESNPQTSAEAGSGGGSHVGGAGLRAGASSGGLGGSAILGGAGGTSHLGGVGGRGASSGSAGASGAITGGAGGQVSGGSAGAISGGAAGSSGGAAGGAGGAPNSAGGGTGGNAGGTFGGAGGSSIGGTGGTGGSALDCSPATRDCDDLLEPVDTLGVSVSAEDGAPSQVEVALACMRGESCLRLVTDSGFLVRVRYPLPAAPLSVGTADEMRFWLRAENTNDFAWQNAAPVVTLEDQGGLRRRYTHTQAVAPKDGISWQAVHIPLGGGEGWSVSGDSIDTTRLAFIEWEFDTWGAGYWVDLDALSFQPTGTRCTPTCPLDCSNNGSCQAWGCSCWVGASGSDCSSCLPGFEKSALGGCQPIGDATYDSWPNPVSSANGDAWLRLHHDEVRLLRPKVLVLSYVNSLPLAAARAIVEKVILGFAEGSKPLGYANPAAAAQLQYQLLPIRDLRDGVAGRPPPPAGYPYENSTLYPRRAASESGYWRTDYDEFFAASYAPHLGLEDPAAPGTTLDLCSAVSRGLVNELWLLGSADVPDASAAEVLEAKPRYSHEGNPMSLALDPCAGNGCFDPDVRFCDRSIRIGFVNYNRGPGCYLHSQGHALESTARRQLIPGFSEWALPFLGFDLNARYPVPFTDLYAVSGACTDCIRYPAPDLAQVSVNGTSFELPGYDGRCGNVHFPPNARAHYDYTNTSSVLSSCADFGRFSSCGEAPSSLPVDYADWQGFEALAPDCGGAFLVWWMQHMPAFGSAQRHPSGEPMKSVWPFLFY